MIKNIVRRMPIRRRLMIILMTLAVVLILVAGAIWSNQLALRAGQFTEFLLTSDLNAILSLGASTINAELLDDAGQTALTARLDQLAQMPERSRASVAVIVADGPDRGQIVASSTNADALTLPDGALPVEPIWLSAPRVDVENVNGSLAEIDGAAWLTAPDADRPLILRASVNANWVFEGRDEVATTMFIAGAVSVPLIAILVVLLARGLTWPIAQITRAADMVARGERFDPKFLDPVIVNGAELGALAQHFSQMALDVQKREEALKAQVQVLEIQIDHVRKQKQIDEIADSDFFKELQRKKEQLRPGSTEDTRPAGSSAAQSAGE